jgi:hypothetical protein
MPKRSEEETLIVFLSASLGFNSIIHRESVSCGLESHNGSIARPERHFHLRTTGPHRHGASKQIERSGEWEPRRDRDHRGL